MNYHRWWFKSVAAFEYAEKQRDTDKEFVSRMLALDKDQHFFIAAFDGGKIVIRNLVKENSSWNLRNLQHLTEARWLTQGTEKLNEHLGALLLQPTLENSFCQTWLSQASDEYLAALLVQRELMNVALDKPQRRYPLDVDAIELDRNSTIFHEFKRKDPCPNGYFVPNTGNCDLGHLYDTRDHLFKENLRTDSELFKFINDELNFSRNEELVGFGLDGSHVKNVAYCDLHGITYKHSLWESSIYPNKPKLSDLFDSGLLNPTKGAEIIVATITPGDFEGFIFTRGMNSGTIHQDPRMQFVISAAKFHNNLTI